uniref:C2H2-type domain-containing protein n=1 Tax=Macrostomum lignano TaxID=282301 RepID=A0A1I8F8V6_9PLAT
APQWPGRDDRGAGISSRNAESPPPACPRGRVLQRQQQHLLHRLWAVRLGADDVACQLESPTARSRLTDQASAGDTKPRARSKQPCCRVNCFSSDSASVQVSALYSRTVSRITPGTTPRAASGDQEPDRRGRRTADNAEALCACPSALGTKSLPHVIRHAEHDGLWQPECGTQAHQLLGCPQTPLRTAPRWHRARPERTTRFRERAAAPARVSDAARGHTALLAACPIKQNSCDLDAQHQLATLKSIQPQKELHFKEQQASSSSSSSSSTPANAQYTKVQLRVQLLGIRHHQKVLPGLPAGKCFKGRHEERVDSQSSARWRHHQRVDQNDSDRILTAAKEGGAAPETPFVITLSFCSAFVKFVKILPEFELIRKAGRWSPHS